MNTAISMNTDFPSESRSNKVLETESLNGGSASILSEVNHATSNRSHEHKRVIFEDKPSTLDRKLLVTEEMGSDLSFDKFQNNSNRNSLPASKNQQSNESISQNNLPDSRRSQNPPADRKTNTQSTVSLDKSINSMDSRTQKTSTNTSHQQISQTDAQNTGQLSEPDSNKRESSISERNRLSDVYLAGKNRQPIIVMKIDLGSGKKDELCLFEGDDPAKVALDFCLKNQLDSKVVDPLTRNIITQLRNYQKLKEERTRQRSLSKGQASGPTTNSDNNPVPKQSRPQNEREDPQPVNQTLSGRPSRENRSSHRSDAKLAAERTRPVIKFELQNGKVLEDEPPQPEKEVKRELFTETEKQNFEAKLTSVHRENSKPESTPINRKEARESLDHPSKGKPGLIHNIYEQIQRPALRSSIVKSPQSNKKLNKSLEKVIPAANKSFTESKKRNELSTSFVDPQKRSYIIDTENSDDQYTKVSSNKYVSPTSRDASFNRLYNDATAKKNRLDQLSAKVKLERTLREEKENTFRPSINKPRDSQRDKSRKLVVQSPTSKLKPQLLLTDFDVTSPNNGSRGSLSVRNINSGSKSNLRSNSRSALQTGNASVKYMYQGSFVEPTSTKNSSKSVSAKEKNLSTTQSFVTTGTSSGKKILNRSSHVLKENRQANISFTQVKSPTNMNKKANESSHTDKKVSLRESILNRTRSEKMLEKQQTKLLGEKAVRQVFNILDASRKGVITAETIDITTIDSKVLELISDILFSLEDEECSMNVQQFYQRLVEQNLIEKLMKLVPVDQEDEDNTVNFPSTVCELIYLN